jgi:hypothetical protein
MVTGRRIGRAQRIRGVEREREATRSDSSATNRETAAANARTVRRLITESERLRRNAIESGRPVTTSVQQTDTETQEEYAARLRVEAAGLRRFAAELINQNVAEEQQSNLPMGTLTGMPIVNDTIHYAVEQENEIRQSLNEIMSMELTAPQRSVSTLGDDVSSGIEPVYSLESRRRTRGQIEGRILSYARELAISTPLSLNDALTAIRHVIQNDNARIHGQNINILSIINRMEVTNTQDSLRLDDIAGEYESRRQVGEDDDSFRRRIIDSIERFNNRNDEPTGDVHIDDNGEMEFVESVRDESDIIESTIRQSLVESLNNTNVGENWQPELGGDLADHISDVTITNEDGEQIRVADNFEMHLDTGDEEDRVVIQVVNPCREILMPENTTMDNRDVDENLQPDSVIPCGEISLPCGVTTLGPDGLKGTAADEYFSAIRDDLLQREVNANPLIGGDTRIRVPLDDTVNVVVDQENRLLFSGVDGEIRTYEQDEEGRMFEANRRVADEETDTDRPVDT